jgi:hypothetical protein
MSYNNDEIKNYLVRPSSSNFMYYDIFILYKLLLRYMQLFTDAYKMTLMIIDTNDVSRSRILSYIKGLYSFVMTLENSKNMLHKKLSCAI